MFLMMEYPLRIIYPQLLNTFFEGVNRIDALFQGAAPRRDLMN